MIAYQKIKRIVSEEGYKLIHVHTPVASFITRLACRRISDVKVLYTAHGFHFFKGAPKKNWIIYHTLEKIAARWTDGLITMNDEDYRSSQKLKLRNRESIYKVHGIGLNLTKFSPQTPEMKQKLRTDYQYSEKDFILIYVGELSYRKHQDLLIKAIGLLKEKIPNIKFLLVGSGTQLNTYKKLVNELDVQNHVEFLGYREDIPQLMTISDIAVSHIKARGASCKRNGGNGYRVAINCYRCKRKSRFSISWRKRAFSRSR